MALHQRHFVDNIVYCGVLHGRESFDIEGTGRVNEGRKLGGCTWKGLRMGQRVGCDMVEG